VKHFLRFKIQKSGIASFDFYLSVNKGTDAIIAPTGDGYRLHDSEYPFSLGNGCMQFCCLIRFMKITCNFNHFAGADRKARTWELTGFVKKWSGIVKAIPGKVLEDVSNE